MQRNILRKLFLGAIALLFIVVACLLFVLPSAHVLASSSRAVDIPTPDTTAVVNSANDAVSRAQDILSIVNVYATILGVVLTLFSLAAAALAFLGIRNYREVLSLAQNLRASVADIRTEGHKTREALVYLGLGDRLLNQKNTTEALENYKKAGSLLPNDAQLNFVLGRIYSGVGDYEAAITALEASHPEESADQGKVQKELGLAYRRRGKAFNQEADYDMAIQCLKKSLVLNPNDSDALAILGGLYRRKKEYVQAFDSYERAWSINPGSSYALGNLASLSWYLGKPDDARMYFGYAEVAAATRIKKGQSEIFWDCYDLALAQLALGKVTEATQTYALAIKETPGEVQFEGVLDNLHLLQKAPQAMPGLDSIVKMIEDAKDRA